MMTDNVYYVVFICVYSSGKILSNVRWISSPPLIVKFCVDAYVNWTGQEGEPYPEQFRSDEMRWDEMSDVNASLQTRLHCRELNESRRDANGS